MSLTVLKTKLFIPKINAETVTRTRLLKNLNKNKCKKLILVSAPAGFGKTTLIAGWIKQYKRQATWLSLCKQDCTPINFLTYLITAIQTKVPEFGHQELAVLQTPGPSCIKSITNSLINEIVSIDDKFTLVLDDYHFIENETINFILSLLLNNMPPNMNLVITTRKKPSFPLARLRARNELAEYRESDLRFTLDETYIFFTEIQHMNFSSDIISSLFERTEGWITGLTLAAASLKNETDIPEFIESLKGKNRYIFDYLIEEVFLQQAPHVQKFLLVTSILERFCGNLCDAVIDNPSILSQKIIEKIQNSNLFIVQLDNEEYWFRYHHLFAEILQHRLEQSFSKSEISEFHNRAAIWHEKNGLVREAVHHAMKSGNAILVDTLLEYKENPLIFQGSFLAILDWIDTLPEALLNSIPSLNIKYAALSLVSGKTSTVKQKLDAAEKALNNSTLNEKNRDLYGQIANARATLAITKYNFDEVLSQSKKALEYLHKENTVLRICAHWTLGVAYQHLGERIKSAQLYEEAQQLAEINSNSFYYILATLGLADIQEYNNNIHLASELYTSVITLFGENPHPITSEAWLGLAKIHYQWNDLEKAREYGLQGLAMAKLYDDSFDRTITCELFLVHLEISAGELQKAEELLKKTSSTAKLRKLTHYEDEITSTQIRLQLIKGNSKKALKIAESIQQTENIARCCIALGDTQKAIEHLESRYKEIKDKGWRKEKLIIRLLLSIAHYISGQNDTALKLLNQLLDTIEDEDHIRLFLDEGPVIKGLLQEALTKELYLEYITRIITAYDAENENNSSSPSPTVEANNLLVEPLSCRELEVLKLIASGLSNLEISDRLSLALDTVKGHNRNIFGKLIVKRRTEAVARAIELKIL